MLLRTRPLNQQRFFFSLKQSKKSRLAYEERHTFDIINFTMSNESGNTFLNYLKTHFDEPIEKYVEKWLKDHLHEMGFMPVDKKHIKLKKLEFCSVRIADRGDLKIGFDLSIRVTARALLHDLFDPTNLFETDIENKWFKMTFNATLANELSDIYILSFAPYEPAKRSKHNPIDGDLLPNLFEIKEYEKFAIEYIRKHVDKNYDGSYVIPIIDLAKKCGLEVWDYKFAGKRRPYGRIFFEDSEFRCFDMETDEEITTGVSANTICVDVTLNKTESTNKTNVTIAHELSHYMLHRTAFLFQRLVNDDLVEFADFIKGPMEAKGFDAEVIDKMEIQASVMAPILLMPRKALIEYTKSIYNDHIVIGGNDDILLFIEDVIRRVAKHFNVTQYAARKRLKECGFFQKADAMVWIDGKYIKPFAYAKGSLEYDETFILSAKQLIQIYQNDKLKKHLAHSKFLFVDNHLVLNSHKYIKRVGNELVMTDYARHNAHKCCLKFKLVNDSKNQFDPLLIDSLFRDANRALAFNLTVAKNDVLKSKYNENSHRNYLANVNEVKAKLTTITSYYEAIRYLKEYQKMSIEELARETELSTSTIKRYLRDSGDMSKPNKAATIRLAIAFQLCEELAIMFCEILGVTFNRKNEDDLTYLMVFQTMSQHPIGQVKKVLTNLNKEHLLELNQ